MPQNRSGSRIVDYPGEVYRLTHPPREDDSGENFNLREILLRIWHGRWVILLSVLAFAVLALLGVSLIQPQYRASATVMFGIERANITDLQTILTSSGSDAASLENEVQILSSSSLIARVVDELDLVSDPNINPNLAATQAEADAGPGLVAGLVDSLPEGVSSFLEGIGLLGVPDAPLSAEETARRDRLATIGAVQDGLLLTPVNGSEVIQISFATASPDTAAKIVNAIADQYIVDQLQTRLDTARAATRWLSDHVDDLRQKVQTSEEAVETLRAQLSNSAGQSIELTQQQIASLNASLSEAGARRSEIEGRYLRMSDALAAGQDVTADSPLVNQYREEESALLARRNALSPNHPARAGIDAQIADLRQRMREEAQRALAALNVDLETARTQESQLQSALRDLEAKGLEQSRANIRLGQLEREADANRLIYQNMLTRFNETAEQESLQETDARVLSPADTPLQPVSDNKVVLLALAGTMGALVGVGIIFLRYQLNNTFRTPPNIEEVTGYNVLGTIPAIGSKSQRREVIRYFLEKPNSSLAESIRNLRTSILFSSTGTAPKVVMFTSSLPAEGKSTTAMLTAIASCQMGKSAIIVDCDLRLPFVAHLVSLNNKQPGLLSVLDGTASLQEAIYQDPKTGLHVLTAQPRESKAQQLNAADVLSSQRFKALIETLSQQYDLVLIDTPPALIVTDARAISPLVDAIVYVVRWNNTPRAAVLDGLKELATVQAPVTGVVLTLVDEAKAMQTDGGYSYHKGGYKDYYTS